MGQDICIRKDEKPLGYDWERKETNDRSEIDCRNI